MSDMMEKRPAVLVFVHKQYTPLQLLPCMMYVCPCIIYEIDERYPLDATIYLLL